MVGDSALVSCEMGFGYQRKLMNMESKDRKLPFLLSLWIRVVLVIERWESRKIGEDIVIWSLQIIVRICVRFGKTYMLDIMRL